jgi:hypothetical protein
MEKVLRLSHTSHNALEKPPAFPHFHKAGGELLKLPIKIKKPGCALLIRKSVKRCALLILK